MGMPVTVELVNTRSASSLIAETFEYFNGIDERYSTYKPSSEISLINAGMPPEKWSKEMSDVLELCEKTKLETNGYFDIENAEGTLDPSGLVKGWAIQRAADHLQKKGARNFYIDAGGDIQTHGRNSSGEPWKIGIRNPFDIQEIVKSIAVSGQAVATSGTYIRGQHIYNPRTPGEQPQGVKSITVIGTNHLRRRPFRHGRFCHGYGRDHFH